MNRDNEKTKEGGMSALLLGMVIGIAGSFLALYLSKKENRIKAKKKIEEYIEESEERLDDLKRMVEEEKEQFQERIEKPKEDKEAK